MRDLGDRNSIRVSRVNSVFDNRPREYPLSVIFKEMRKGNGTLTNLVEDIPYRTLAQVTERARELRYQLNNEEAYEQIKREMPQIFPAAVLSTRSEIQSFSNLVCLEWDGEIDVDHALMTGKQHPNVLAIWRSLSGNPKFLIPISPISKDGDELTKDNFVHAWYDASILFEEIGDADAAAMRPTQPQALCYDPNLYVNWDAMPIEWDIDEDAFAEAYPNFTKTENVAYAELPAEYHEAIENMVWKDNGWGETSVPCPWGDHEHDGWFSRANATGIYKNGENDYTFHCLKCPKPKSKRRYSENPKQSKRRASIRLSHVSGHVPESAQLETVRKLNNDGVSRWLRETSDSNDRFMLVLTGGAGGGKSTATRQNIKTFADISPTIAQADEKYDDALGLGKKAMRHRSRYYNRDTADEYTPENVLIGLNAELGEVPCAFPAQCEALAINGGSPVNEYCISHCPRHAECQAYGYLSQWRIFSEFDEIYLSYQDDIFSDPRYAGYIERIAESKEDFVLVLDEAAPASLPPKRGYETDRIKRMADDYKDFETGEFLTQLITETASAVTPLDWTNAVKTVIAGYDDDTLDAIDRQMHGMPVDVQFERVPKENLEYDLNGNALYMTLAHITYGGLTKTCAVLCEDVDVSAFEYFTETDYPAVANAILPRGGWVPGQSYQRLLYLTTFCAIGFGSLKTVDDILKIPFRYQDFTKDLREFVASVNSDTPPASENTTTVVIDGKRKKAHVGWTYYLRPGMNARRGILISASGGFNEITELYRDSGIHIEHLTTPPVKWEPGNKVFQISTGRYTPKSALLNTENGKVVDITDKGQSFLDVIHTEVSQNPHRSLVVAPKPLTADGELAELDAVKTLCLLDHVKVTNHFHTEGTNRYTGVENIFILHFEPSVDEIKSIAARIHRNETLSFERETVDLEKAGVKLETVNRYVDPRVQDVFDRECEKRIYQTLMRGRQMLDTGVDCYVFLFTAEPISGLPIAPIFFEFDDLVKCHEEHGTIRKLEEYLASKAELSVKELAELEGKSVWTTYKRIAEQRKQAKADKDAELLWKAEELLHKGVTQSGTARELGITRGKLQSLLKRGAA